MQEKSIWQQFPLYVAVVPLSHSIILFLSLHKNILSGIMWTATQKTDTTRQ